MGTVQAYIDQRIQVGQESSSGTPASCNRKLQELMLGFKDELTTRQVRPPGHRFDTDSFVEEEWTSLTIAGAIDFYEQHLPLEAMCGAATPTTPVGGTLSKQRIYDVPISGAVTPQSFTAQWGDNTFVNQAAYIVVPTLGGTYSREKGGDMTGAAFGGLILPGGTTFTGGANPYGSSPYTTHPALGKYLNFYLDTTGAGLGTTQILEEVLEAKWNIQDLFKPFWAADRAQTAWKRPISNEAGKYTADITFGESSTVRTIIDALRSQQTYFLRIEMLGPLIEGSIHFLHQVDLAVKLITTSEWKNGNSVYARDVSLDIVEDPTWGHGALVTTVCDLATL